MYRFVFKQILRERFTLLRNHLIASIALMAAIILFLRTMILGIYNSGFTLADHKQLLCVIFSGVCLLSLLFQKIPVFYVHPALFFYTYNTQMFQSVKRYQYIKKFLIKFALAFAINLVVFNFRVSVHSLISVCIMSVYFFQCSLLRWVKSNKKLRCSLTLFMLSSIVFVASYSISVYFFVPHIFLLILITWLAEKLEVDWGQFFDVMMYRARMNFASNHNDIAQLQQITTENIATRKHSLRIYHLPIGRKNALLCKAVIESTRMSKQVVLILVASLGFSILLNTTSIFRSVPLLGEPQAAKAIGVLCTCLFLANLKEIYSKQIISIWDKHREGLFLPYTNLVVVFSYAVICCIVTSLTLLILSLILGASLLNSIAAIIGVNIVLVSSFVISRKQKIYNKTVIISNALFFALTWLIY